MVSGPNNALAEVALALAMGFFSIMVLAMVSMGAAVSEDSAQQIKVVPGLNISLPLDAQNNAAATETVSGPSILIHYRGRFLNAQLIEVSPEDWKPEGSAVLAIEPTLTFSEVMALRGQVDGLDVKITTLDQSWVTRLKEIGK